MICTNCGNEIPEGDRFCCVCGQGIPDAVPVEEYSQNVVNDGYYWEEPAAAVPEQPKKKGIKLWLLLGGIGLVLAALVVVLIFVIKSNGPAAAVHDGVKNVLDEQTFTIAIKGKVDNDKVKADIQVDLDVENRDLSLICVTYEGDDDPDLMAIYDGYLIWSYHEYTEYYDSYNDQWTYEKGELGYRAEDISDELEILFDAYARLREGDASLQEMMETLIDDIGDDYLEESYEEIEDHVNVEVLEACLKTYCQMLNDESWMEENANLTIEEEDGMTLYSVDPDLYDFTMISVECFQEAFEDEDDYDDLVKQLKREAKKYLKEMKAEITIGIEDGMLVYGTIDGEAFHDTCDLTMEITDIGETAVDKEMLEDILDEAEIR